MRQGKASVLHKESRTGSWATHKAAHPTGRRVARREDERHKKKKRQEEREAVGKRTEKTWCAHVNKRFLAGSVWAPCSSSCASTLSQSAEVSDLPQKHLLTLKYLMDLYSTPYCSISVSASPKPNACAKPQGKRWIVIHSALPVLIYLSGFRK